MSEPVAEVIVDRDGVKVWEAHDPDYPHIRAVAQSRAEALDELERTKKWVAAFEAEQPNTTLERP